MSRISYDLPGSLDLATAVIMQRTTLVASLMHYEATPFDGQQTTSQEESRCPAGCPSNVSERISEYGACKQSTISPTCPFSVGISRSRSEGPVMTSTRPTLSRGTGVNPLVVQILAADMCLKAVMHEAVGTNDSSASKLLLGQTIQLWPCARTTATRKYERRERVTRTDPQGGDREKRNVFGFPPPEYSE